MSDLTEPATPRVEGTVQTFLTFRPYPLQVGQKIFIDGGSRRGDWEVIGLSDRKVRLRCPFSSREVEWDRFCYLVEEKKGAWPHPD
jgi:hypothetical protein